MTPRTDSRAWSLWNLGFRPFFLAAGLHATVAIAWWTVQFAGWLPGVAHLANPYWHAHEMIFGYALAVITGFLFTAVRNWTGRPTPTGKWLAAIIMLWLAGRILPATPWPLLAAAADTAFVLAAAAGIGIPLVASGNRRNFFFVPLLLVLGGANLLFHLGMNGRLELPVRDMLQLALNVIALIMAIMGGRVIPMFTANAIPDARPARHPALEAAAIGSLLLLLAADLFGLPSMAVAAVAGAGAAAHA